jgi:hypothetical protein
LLNAELGELKYCLSEFRKKLGIDELIESLNQPNENKEVDFMNPNYGYSSNLGGALEEFNNLYEKFNKVDFCFCLLYLLFTRLFIDF